MTISKEAEKTYLGLTGSSAWERAKPFSHLLHDFAVAMMALQPAADDLILDLGAGGCWCSDLLRKLHRQSVAVDISLEMLQAGRSRPGGSDIRAVSGDMEALPFRAGTFDKAVCLSAVHHVPDIPAAMREIARVLTADGVALFSEPGVGHAEAAVSMSAMRDFGVLEQDILVPQFVGACRNAGFVDVRIKTLSYAIPAFDLTLEQWQQWTRLARSKRPVRAVQKMVRALAEFAGFGKRGALFEEAFGMSLVRTLRHAMEDHPIILASKVPIGPSLSVPARLAAIVLEMPDRVDVAAAIAINARLTNRGSEKWRAATAGAGQVRLGIQLLDPNGRLRHRDYHRIDLPADLPPGGSIALSSAFLAPETPGEYMFKFDLVAEGVTWFEAAGSPAVIRKITVR
jgi:ubiquinone/menaquinone biosynthesis C-methylase UbiE